MKKAPSAIWVWEGDPDARDGYTVVGTEDDGTKTALVDYDSIGGATAQPLDDGICGRMIMPLEKAKELHDRICVMDEAFWPGFNPTVARVVDGKVVEYIEPPDEPEPWPG